MKILVFSDSHAIGYPSSWKAFFDKRAIGLFNHVYIRKHSHNQNLIDLMITKLEQISPDIVFCTGDITTDGEPSEFNFCCNKLQSIIKNKNFEFYYIPGNHDYYVNDKFCYKALQYSFKYLNRNKLNLEDLPYSFSLKGIDFCLVNESYPVFMLFSNGIMKKETSSYILNWCNNGSGKPKVLVGHYPLIESYSLFRLRHKLWGHGKIKKALIDEKIDLSLCGHVHAPSAIINKRGRGEIIAGSVTQKGCIASIEYNKQNNIFHYQKISIIS